MTGKGIQGRAKSGKSTSKLSRRSGSSQKVIPDAVANRMARRIAIGTGIPTLMGMGVFVGSYLLVSRQIFDVPPSATLAASGGCFFLGLLGLSFGVLSASWEEKPGSLLGTEQIGLNISRLRSSIKASRNS
jgi:drug/metabolite transporter (DMT)-like permease